MIKRKLTRPTTLPEKKKKPMEERKAAGKDRENHRKDGTVNRIGNGRGKGMFEHKGLAYR